MKRAIHRSLSAGLVLTACVCAVGIVYCGGGAPEAGADPVMTVTTSDERGSTPGGNEHFTGESTISMLFSPDGPRNFSGAYVTFQPGARTAWHSHPAGQTLVVTEGNGWVQVEGGQRRDLKPGDVVWTPPGVRHWHGATTSSAMTHIALQGDVDGTAVNWFEKVTDDQYQGLESD